MPLGRTASRTTAQGSRYGPRSSVAADPDPFNARTASVSPGSRETSNAEWIAGRRRSADTTRTRLPACANAVARFAATVVLPSRASGLVTRIVDAVAASVSDAHRWTPTWSRRKAPAALDRG